MTINIQPGHIARHTPKKAGAQGREAAVIDVAQDLLLQHLSEMGSLDNVAIKGGTAIRKLYAGKEGRFSLDLDFALAYLNDDRNSVARIFAESTDGLVIGPFTYGVSKRRGKWSVTFASRFVAEPTLATKLDFSPAPWMEPVFRNWAPMPIHDQYDKPLPSIKTVRLEENIAEKIARLNRTTTARDMYDLAWIMNTPAVAQTLNLALIRRLAVLKIWVDTNGMHSDGMVWNPGHEGSSFESRRWLRCRGETEFDLEDIGALAVATPSLDELNDSVRRGYSFLAELDSAEMVLSQSDERDRSLAIRMLKELPDGRLNEVRLY